MLAAWKNYFQTQFPLLRVIIHNIWRLLKINNYRFFIHQVVFFTSLPSYNLRGGERKSGLKAQRRKGTMKMAAEGALKLLEVRIYILLNPFLLLFILHPSLICHCN